MQKLELLRSLHETSYSRRDIFACFWHLPFTHKSNRIWFAVFIEIKFIKRKQKRFIESMKFNFPCIKFPLLVNFNKNFLFPVWSRFKIPFEKLYLTSEKGIQKPSLKLFHPFSFNFKMAVKLSLNLNRLGPLTNYNKASSKGVKTLNLSVFHPTCHSLSFSYTHIWSIKPLT